MTTPRLLRRLRRPSSNLIPTTICPPCRRPYSTSLDFARVKADLQSRPPKLIHDTLSPTSSHLLNIILSDFLPSSCQPLNFKCASPVYPTTDDTLLPEAHHLVYFPPQIPASGLCPDGTDPFHSPGPPFERRMWAGGSITFNKPLLIRRQPVVCRESIGDVALRGGQPGEEKIFVDVWRRYGEEGFAEGEEAITERRSLVFLQTQAQPPVEKPHKAKAAPGSPSRWSEAPPSFSFKLTPTQTLLFHYSALTFNAHMIHLDPAYTQQVEGHRNVLVHGPLSLTLILSALRSQLKAGERIHSIDYRNLAPLYAEESMTVCVRLSSRGQNGMRSSESTPTKRWDVWIEGQDGGLRVKGGATSVIESA